MGHRCSETMLLSATKVQKSNNIDIFGYKYLLNHELEILGTKAAGHYATLVRRYLQLCHVISAWIDFKRRMNEHL